MHMSLLSCRCNIMHLYTHVTYKPHIQLYHTTICNVEISWLNVAISYASF